MKYLTIQSPARICLFGDHQDYLGLPVIACAINRFIRVTAVENDAMQLRISLPNTGEERIFNLSEDIVKTHNRDYLASSLLVAKRYDCLFTRGFDVTIEGDVPINAGVSSSSAMVVGLMLFLMQAYGNHRFINPELIAKMAYEAEVVEFNSPGGLMDQYTIAIGGLVHINTGKFVTFDRLSTTFNGLILAESGIPKQTLSVLGNLRGLATQSIEIVTKAIPGFRLEKATLANFDNCQKHLPENLKPYFYAALKNHEITQKALNILKSEPSNLKGLGSLMTEHHLVLKDVLQVSTPQIDVLINAALTAGAYGAKIVGSGGGGSITAIVPVGKEFEVCQAIKEAGAKNAYPVTVDEGAAVLNVEYAQ